MTHEHHPNGAAPSGRRAVIDLGAVARNVARLKRCAEVDEFIAVVKANGYGHGAVEIARAAIDGGATRIGVADLNEAKTLVDAGIDGVPVVAWLHHGATEFKDALAAGIEVGVSSTSQLLAVLAGRSTDQPASIHIKVETGLGRGGAAPAEWGKLYRIASESERAGRIRVVGIFSHLSNTSPAEDLRQLEQFRRALREAAQHGVNPPLHHLAASAATMAVPETRLNTVRVGVGIYGLSPFDDPSYNPVGLEPAMTLEAPVIAVRHVAANHGVSYGYDYRTSASTRLVLVPLGYADGIPRQASGRARVRIGEKLYPVAGRIAMDQFVVDVGGDNIRVGDTVTVFGNPEDGAPSADSWATAAGTINYDIVTRIGSRVDRVYSNS